MKNKLTELALLRLVVENRKSKVEMSRKELEGSPFYEIHQIAKENYMEAKVVADVLADEIKEKVINGFEPWNNGGNKKPYDGIQIKEFKTIKVTDEKKAIKWAVDSEQFNLVSLAKSQFNKVAKVLDLDFVKKDKEYRAQIASDLSMYEDTENE